MAEVADEDLCFSDLPEATKHTPGRLAAQSKSGLNAATWNAFTRISNDFLRSLDPPLSENSITVLLRALQEHGHGLSVLRQFDLDSLKGLGVDSLTERAQILAAVAGDKLMGPPPLPHPVLVEVKIGFVGLGQIDTVNQTVWSRFFCDMYWNDPRLIGATSVPDGTWFPEGVYFPMAMGELTIVPYDAPLLMDIEDGKGSKAGRLLWAMDVQGYFANRMSLRTFPFDHDQVEIYLHQGEHADRNEYVLRPFGGGWNGYRTRSDEETMEMERTSVNFFFDVFTDVDEWHVSGFSLEAWEGVGGNAAEYSHYHLQLHMERQWLYYGWKIVLPLVICTLFCMSSFLFHVDDLEARNNTSVTMFLATSALLYVVASVLPRQADLTQIDKFVIQTLLVQFLVGGWSWIQYKLLYKQDMDWRKDVDFVMLCVCFFGYMICTLLFFREPIVKKLGLGLGAANMIHSLDSNWSHYYPFERFTNVWPKGDVGVKPPNALEPHWYVKKTE